MLASSIAGRSCKSCASRPGWALARLALASLLFACGASPVDAAAPDVPPVPSRWLGLEGVTNARDLGGYPAAAGARVRYRVLLRSGDLSRLGAAGCDAYADLGVATLIDLREAGEVAAAPDAACAVGPGYHQVPLPKLLPPTADSYLALLDRSGPALAEVFALLAAPGGLPALHHCVIGRDRASVVSATILLALGVSEADVLQDFLLSGAGGIAVEGAWLQAVLDEIERQGGVEPFLAERGVPAERLAALRAAALE